MKWHLFKKSKPISQVDATTMVEVDTSDKSTAQELGVAMKQWRKKWRDIFGKHAKIYRLFNDKGMTAKEFQVFFSPYAFESFLAYYKTLVDRNETIPHTDGNIFKPALVTVNLYFNNFLTEETKDDKGNPRQVLDSQHLIYKYKADPQKGCIISDRFSGHLMLLNRLIFFYNYTVEDLSNREDPAQEFKNCKDMAKMVRRTYEQQMPKHYSEAQLATEPNQLQFERQETSSVHIPALVSADTREDAKNTERRNTADKDYFAKYVNGKQRQSEAEMSPAERSLKAESDSIARAEVAAKVASRAKSANAQSSSATSSVTSRAESHTSSVASSASQRPSSASSVGTNTARLQSEASYYKSLALTKSKPSQAVSNPSAEKPSAPSNSANLVDVHKFAKSHFPITDDPSIIKGGIQLLMDKDSNMPDMFRPDFQLKTFNVNNSMPAPASIKDAIKSGKLDNQKYVIQMDNQNKKIANSVITSRSRVLNMGYARMLTELLYGAYSKISQKTAVLLQQTSNDNALKASARGYYNKHFNDTIKRIEAGRTKELNAVNKGLYDAYLSKKRLKDNKINARYDKEKRQAHTKISDMTKDVFYKARNERNKELRQQISALTRSDIRKVRLQIRDHNTEWAHKMSQASKFIFNTLQERLQAQHNEAIRTVSKLISKQTDMMDAQANIRQARAQMLRNRGNRQMHAQLAKQQAQQQAYINKLNAQIGDYTNKLTNLQASDQATKNKMNQIIASNQALKGQLTNANTTIINNQKQIEQGRANLTKLNEIKAQNAEQQQSFATERNSYKAKNQSIVADTASASALASYSASSSASAQIQSNEMQVLINNNSYQDKIYKLSNSLKSASQAQNANRSVLQGRLNNAQKALSTYRSSASATNSAKAQMVKDYKASVSQSVSSRNATYESNLAKYSQALQSASHANVNTSALNNQLSGAKQALSDYQSFVTKSNSSQQASLATHNSAVKESMAERNQSYENNMASYSNALDSASQANGDVSSLRNQLNDAQNSFMDYRASVSASNSVKASSVASRNDSINRSVAARNFEYQNKLGSYESALNSASQANASMAQVQGQLDNAKQSLHDYQVSVATTNSLKDASVASRSAQIQDSIKARNVSYQSKLQSYSVALSNQSSASDTAKANALNHSLSVAKQSFASYQATVSSVNSQRDASEASYRSSINASVGARNASYQSELSGYSDAYNSASQANFDTQSATDQLSAFKQSLADYKAKVSESDMARSLSVAQSEASASARDDSYKSKIDNLMDNLGQASQANANTASAQAQLTQYRQAFSSFRTSMSTANSLRDESMANSYQNRDDSYQATITRMKSNEAQISKANSITAENNQSNASLTSSASAQVNEYRSEVASYKSSFAHYKQSVSASSSSEKESVSASNSTTSSMMSSATFGSSSNNSAVAEQTYNPEEDELEQQRLLEKEQQREAQVQNKHKQVKLMHKKRKKKKKLWEL